MTHSQKNCGHAFVQHLVGNVCTKITFDRLSRFRTGAGQVFTSQKPFPSEISLHIFFYRIPVYKKL